MGFPYTYQFVGGESTKWKQIGNAVCPHMASALAKAILDTLGYPIVNELSIDFSKQIQAPKQDDLTNPIPKDFKAPPKKKVGTKFRMQPFKGANMICCINRLIPGKTRRKGWERLVLFYNLWVR